MLVVLAVVLSSSLHFQGSVPRGKIPAQEPPAFTSGLVPANSPKDHLKP